MNGWRQHNIISRRDFRLIIPICCFVAYTVYTFAQTPDLRFAVPILAMTTIVLAPMIFYRRYAIAVVSIFWVSLLVDVALERLLGDESFIGSLPALMIASWLWGVLLARWLRVRREQRQANSLL